MTFLQELECDIGDKSVSLTAFKWANGFTINPFKITDGLIKPGIYGLRFKSDTGSVSFVLLFAAPVNENIKVIVYY